LKQTILEGEPQGKRPSFKNKKSATDYTNLHQFYLSLTDSWNAITVRFVQICVIRGKNKTHTFAQGRAFGELFRLNPANTRSTSKIHHQAYQQNPFPGEFFLLPIIAIR
jgi:hypothetical protein